jgi:hypothetical protein
MRIVNAIVILVIGAVAVVSTTAMSQPDGRTVGNAQLSPVLSASQALLAELAYQDSLFFDAVFTTCNFEKVGEFITDDFEFYHDKWGLIATSRKEFVESIKNLCERQQQGIDYRARRELVKGSMAVYPLNNYGAIQMGLHRFYQKIAGKDDQPTEVAQFTHVWKKDDGAWKISRVLSYDHKPAE